MRKLLLAFAVLSWAARAEVRILTLRQAIERAVNQHPDVVIARLNEQIAGENIRVARGPFNPRVIVGSGAAWSSGFPMSIEGSAPAIVQARAIQSIYNRPLSFRVAAAREEARGAAIDSSARRAEVAHRTATLYLEADRARRQADLATKQVESLERVAEVVRARVSEGRELDIENRRSALSLGQARQRALTFRADQDNAEANLAVALGFGPDDRVRPASDDQSVPAPQRSEEQCVEEALASSAEIRRLEASLRAKALELESAKSARWPQFDLVAQYGLFAKFQKYEEFFRRFERHNGQLGISLALPILPGGSANAEAARTNLEMQRMRTELNVIRERIALDTRRRYAEQRTAESARDVARLDLEVAREQLGIVLAQSEEGRAGLRQVEEARTTESARWIAYYDAQHAVEQARLNLLRQTGDILAVLQ
ncbi:MAG TPA: TolC family protein [Bryobacteraceae bacterium]|nr:TolC family protein [Bryobacteraceae bacterium]